MTDECSWSGWGVFNRETGDLLDVYYCHTLREAIRRHLSLRPDKWIAALSLRRTAVRVWQADGEYKINKIRRLTITQRIHD